MGGRAYLVTVRALDALEISPMELTTTVRTPDDQAPQWPNPRLTVRADVTEASLSWSEATDNLAVVAYRGHQNDVQVSETTERQLSVESLSPSTEYTFRVEAGDVAGNWSADGPVQQVTTEAAYDQALSGLHRCNTHTRSPIYSGNSGQTLYARRAALGLDPGKLSMAAALHTTSASQVKAGGIHNNSETAIHKIALSLDPIRPVVDSVVWIQWSTMSTPRPGWAL